MAKDTDKGQPQTGGNVAGPDVMLGMWASWMDRMAAPAQAAAGQGKPWWQMTTDAPAPDVLAGGVKQLEEGLSKDPTLRSIDQMWNANPLREVVPIDWAEIARALRTVWLRSLSKPETAKAIAEFNTDLWRAARGVGQGAGRRGRGRADPPPPQGPASAAADKRFAAPEWHTNPVYRTLKEVYLLASDWLMQQADAVEDDMDETERQRINFHLRQFVDAMSPTLMLMSNPAALHKAIETGGASVVAGARNLMADLNAGRLTMVDAEAFAPGRNLALTPGKVVHRNRLIELIQYAPTTEQVHKTPLLILPPWINKFYILDMQPKNSMIRYLELRSNDLIWSNVVNNYLLGNKPPAFDLLYWNADGTRMARAAHSWYVRNTYIENNLVKPGTVTLKGEPIDLARIRLDTYAAGAEKDHIVPWDAAWRITQLFGGDVRFVLASSGHIAGIINPPGGKGNYWTRELKDARCEQPGAVAAERHEARGQLVARLVGLALRAVSRKRKAAIAWQQEAPANRKRAGSLRAGEIGPMAVVRLPVAQRH